MLIMKFGGTSVGSAFRMKQLIPLIQNGETKIVVLSAMAGTTNALLSITQSLYLDKHVEALLKIDQLANSYETVVNELFNTNFFINKGIDLIQSHFQFIRNFTQDSFTIHEEKSILAQGELISTALFHLLLEENDISSALLPALDFMRINEEEEPDYPIIGDLIAKKLESLYDQKLIITQGFICRNAFGQIDNLKRGGSDFTATILGSLLNAKEIQIWTDIDGMHNNDPRVVEKTFPITELSYEEAAELAYFGARILHPTCVLPAQKAKVPIRLLNTMKPDAEGTIISNFPVTRPVTAIAAKDDITVINIKSGRMLQAYGFLRNVFEVFERYKTPIDMITTSEVAVSLTIDNPAFLNEITNELETFGEVQTEKEQTILCIVGDFSRDRQDQAFMVLNALKEIPIRMISYGGSEHNISILIHCSHKKAAMLALNHVLFNTRNA